jgi:tripartite-type tricarboxylate transporter receptor subunit TctC
MRDMIKNVPVDMEKDFRAVGMAMELPMAVAVNASLPVRNIKEYIALARSRPGEMSYGTAGPRGLHMFVGETLKLAQKINVTLVPFQGEVPAVTAAVGGHVTGVVVNVFSTAPFIKAGKLRGLLVTSKSRDELVPQVPTAREAGIPDMEGNNWNGYLVPAATPTAAVERFNAEMNKVLNLPEVREILRTQGLYAAPMSPSQFAAIIASDTARYRKVIKVLNLQPE